jgi:two-component system sensor histidine kinase ChiS
MAQRITIIDDDEELIYELKSMLDAEGYDSTTYSNSADGYSAVRASPPDLLLLDIKMENLSGLQIADMLLSDQTTKSVPIIFLSGNFNREEIMQATTACETAEYLAKPIDPEELLKAIERVSNAKKSTPSGNKKKSLQQPGSRKGGANARPNPDRR